LFSREGANARLVEIGFFNPATALRRQSERRPDEHLGSGPAAAGSIRPNGVL
jgi:hypothetical protein